MIAGEINIIVRSMLWGMILAFEYDTIRIFRRIIKHYHVWTMSLEDIIFWINVGFTIFAVSYDVNDGIVRGFLIGGFVTGAMLFKYSFGPIYVKYISKFILFIFKPLKKAFKMIRMCLGNMLSKRLKEKDDERKENS